MVSNSRAAGLVALLAGVAQAQYALDVTYDASNFLDEFSFFTEPDPTHGFVDYIGQQAALDSGLASVSNGVLHMGVDATTMNPANGRRSVRISSNRSFTHGLILGDFEHLPSNVCGSWPAFWSHGDAWPSNGEIDILEGVNNQDATAVTLHTNPGCTITNEGADPSTLLKGTDCGAGNAFTGCGQQTTNTENYGSGANAVNGGIYALEWTSEAINMWFFPRASTGIPQDILDGNPEPSLWPNPAARFVGGGGCNIDDYFREHKIIFDTTFCGDWAGAPDVWNNNPTCSALANTCVDYVSNNPEAFADVFWTVNSVKVYQKAANKRGVPFTA
jgi:beta-glucanase (GH16 family)